LSLQHNFCEHAANKIFFKKNSLILIDKAMLKKIYLILIDKAMHHISSSHERARRRYEIGNLNRNKNSRNRVPSESYHAIALHETGPSTATAACCCQ
jgi:hypothetical protein